MSTRETTGGEKLVIILGYDPDGFFNMLKTSSIADLKDAWMILSMKSSGEESEHIKMLTKAGLTGIVAELERRSTGSENKKEKKMRYTIGWVVFGLLVIFGIGWVVRANFFAQEAVFAPKEEALRRTTFEESKAFNDGMAQEIQSMQFEYIKATPDQKAALKSIILHKTAAYDLAKFPADTRAFIESLRKEAP